MTRSFANRPLRVELDDVDLDAGLSRSVSSVLLRQIMNAPSLTEMSFAEPPRDSLSALRVGARLTLVVGSDARLFSGEITTLEWRCDGASARVLRVRAYDNLHRLRKTQRGRTLAGVSAGDVVTRMAAELGLDAAVDEAGPTQNLAVQWHQCDLDFVTELAARSGLSLFLDDRVLRLFTLAGRGEPIRLQLGRDLAEVRATRSAETVRRSTHARAWNLLRTEAIDADATTPRRDSHGPPRVDVSSFGDLGVRTLFNRLAASADECQGFAQADIDRAAASELVIEGAADGDPRLRPGRIVAIEGIADEFDGNFTLNEVVHRFSEDAGYITEFSSAPPRRAESAKSPTFTFGVVSDVEDPEEMSRVRATFPLLGDLQSEWMSVIAAGAGQDKGLAVMPAVGDKVLILFSDGNPAYGVVLGGLYGEGQAPGQTGSPPHPYVLRTGNGQTLTLDDANSLARIETSGGDTFQLGPRGSRLHATQDLLIEAPGRKLTIRAKAVEFEEG